MPLVLAAPLALIQLAYDRLSRSRALLAELAGATAMASVAASIALALLLLRSLYGLSGRDGAASAKQVGIREFVFGAMTVLAVALGHHFDL